MPSNTLDDLLFSAVAARSRATDVAGTQTLLVIDFLQEILAAVISGLYEATYDASAVTDSKDLQWVIEELRHDGYTVVLDGTDVIISW